MTDVSPPSAVILTYHNVLPPAADGDGDPASIPFDRLLEHLECLQRHGLRAAPLQEVVARLTTRASWGDPLYALTFDDGYESLYDYLPRLPPQPPPTLFLLTDALGGDNSWNTRAHTHLKHLTVEMVRDLQRRGADVQLHGCDHHKLTKFSAAELAGRFERGISWFERTLGTVPRYLAYPYGTCNAQIVEVASRYFAACFATNHGSWQGADASHRLNRIGVSAHLDGEGLLAVITARPERRWIESEQRVRGRA
jgi:peptidoglycan/xylan/chitin deacetylase (PgdA/CDA1 family)